MKIHEYNEMMAYLTRPGMRTGGQIIGKPGGLVEPGVTNYAKKAKFKITSGPGTGIAEDNPQYIKIVKEEMSSVLQETAATDRMANPQSALFWATAAATEL